MNEYNRGPSVPDEVTVDDLFYRPWLKVEHVREMENEEIMVTVQDVTEEIVYIQGEGKTGKYAVWSYEIERALIVNKTRSTQISEVCGSDAIGTWKNQKICIYIDPAVRNPNKGGAKGPALRVKAPPLATTSQISEISGAGEVFYQDQWLERKPKLMEYYSSKRTSSFDDIYAYQADHLMAMLTARIEEFGTCAEWEAQQVGETVAEEVEIALEETEEMEFE